MRHRAEQAARESIRPIVGVDEFDFEGPTVAPDVPDFIVSATSLRISRR
jgi:hypothetical protein